MCLAVSNASENRATRAGESIGFLATEPLKILLWHLLSLGFVLLFALFAIGKPSVLEYSARIKPYAVVFQTKDSIKSASLASDRVIIFFGDSSVAQPPWAGKDAPHIPAILADELRESHPGLDDVSVIEWAFNGARMFHYYCLLFEAEKYSPDLLIIPINWRGLGPRSMGWREKYAFPELSALAPFSEWTSGPGKSILELEGISPPEQFIYRLQRPTLYLRGLRMWVRIKLGMESEEEPLSPRLKALPPARVLMSLFSDEELFRTYANEIADSNTQLRTLRALVETSARRGTRLLFYITPIHAEEMRRRPRFNPRTFRESTGRVVEAATSETSACLNLAELLGEDDFIDFYEHYKPEGNREIARALAPAVHRLITASENRLSNQHRDMNKE